VLNATGLAFFTFVIVAPRLNKNGMGPVRIRR
jgi:hypothetical protein